MWVTRLWAADSLTPSGTKFRRMLLSVSSICLLAGLLDGGQAGSGDGLADTAALLIRQGNRNSARNLGKFPAQYFESFAQNYVAAWSSGNAAQNQHVLQIVEIG